ncbi:MULTISPECIES: peptidoglycan-associated lipoprotein Pal [Microvirgula]|uniref:Peptidoglycan-associated lipoprotein n=1 Tax=Microvirgula aerodenitrificans TaxID=57480 RepID=A0A2S0P8G4_9NEIS|nr:MULTISPECIES: peptidoglycan-associated lipoprotein Pal [Microvirgula]AVY93603.1 peptidoglycan-associated lipoprotein Pal [Microvirgula aerodenitrificans]RAS20145.1 peptidoglycan-associated lipoprotein [Microvirgula sp. AG722]
MLKQTLTAVAVAALLAACASTKPADSTNANAGANAGNGGAVAGGTAGQQIDPLKDPNNVLSKRSVFFGFDSSAVSNEYKPVVQAHAEYLKQNSNRKVQIQGNTDARGSREYNLALGQRRSEAVKQMMRVIGVPEAQLEAVSFGKEKPRATGNTDADFAANRRADVVYDGE